MVNNPLKYYFLKIKEDHNLKINKDIATHLNLSISIVNNAMNGKTVNPSRKLVKTLSSNLNQKPEIILRDIYNRSFCEPCNDYIKIVTSSLFYNFGYTIFYDKQNFMEFSQIKLPYTMNHRICSYAKIRNNGPELKYTLILDWCNVRKVLCNAYINDFNYVYDDKDPTKHFHNWYSFFFAMTSGLFALLKMKSMSDIKRIFVVFPTVDAVHYECIREMLYDYQGGITPLLYDKNAEYSIRDVDMLNGRG